MLALDNELGKGHLILSVKNPSNYSSICYMSSVPQILLCCLLAVVPCLGNLNGFLGIEDLERVGLGRAWRAWQSLA